MSRLSEILGVKEGQEFRHGNKERTYKVVDEFFYMKKDRGDVFIECANIPVDMIAHPELIHPIPEKPQLTEQQITAIKGRIADGTPWAVRNRAGGLLYTYEKKPKLSDDQTYFYSEEKYRFPIESDLYDFITFENSPVYLPELVEGSEK